MKSGLQFEKFLVFVVQDMCACRHVLHRDSKVPPLSSLRVPGSFRRR